MQDLRKIFRYARPYRRDLFAAVGLIFIECIFEMVIPVLMSTLVDDGVPTHNMTVIFRQGGLMILCAVLALITGLLYARYAARFANGFAAELRMAEYAAVQKFDFANLDRFSDASLVTRMTTDVTVMLNAVNAGLRPLVRSPVMLCMGLAMACVLSPRLTIVFLVTTPILAAVLAWIVTKVGPLYGRQQSAVDHLNGRIQESLTAIRAIKAFVRGDYENAQFDTVNTELSDASTETFRYAVLNLPAFQTVMYTAIVCILWFGGNYILVGTMSVGQLTAFLSYVLQVLNSVMMFSGVFLQMSRSLASARRIREVLTETPDLANAAAPVDTIPDGQIDFDHVSFKYNAKAEKNALSDITLHIPAGATVGIIGGTGTSKSTLVQLIPRLYDATEGRVLVNGQDVARLRRRKIPYLRRQMGIIFQDFRLIPSMTVYENVAFAMHVLNVPHKEIRPRVEYILELVHLEDKAKCYPDTLSGGEQQRVAVARALVHNPKLVIADEPTGNIDPELSLEMMQLLERVSKMGITVLVVTHEHELVHRFHQRVVTLSHGRIVSDVPADPVAAAEDDLSLDIAAFDADDASAAKKEVAAV